MQIWIKGLCLCVLVVLSACQSMFPKAQGLVQTTWPTDAMMSNYQRQDQVEVMWKDQSFSFLLYQQQKGEILEMFALTLTGQQLFKLQFDGKSVHVQDRIPQMRLLPFDFVVRDILFATYPNFAKKQPSNVELMQELNHTTIKINKNNVLLIEKKDNSIELDNVQVPYKMIFTSVENTLEDNSLEDQALH